MAIGTEAQGEGKHQITSTDGQIRTKLQAPNNKQGPNGKTKRTKPKKQTNLKQNDWSFSCFRSFCLVLGVYAFGSCLLFGACDLVLLYVAMFSSKGTFEWTNIRLPS
jgi:hypothetical protein